MSILAIFSDLQSDFPLLEQSKHIVIRVFGYEEEGGGGNMKGGGMRRREWGKMNIERRRRRKERYRKRRDMSPVICSNVPDVVVCIFF